MSRPVTIAQAERLRRKAQRRCRSQHRTTTAERRTKLRSDVDALSPQEVKAARRRWRQRKERLEHLRRLRTDEAYRAAHEREQREKQREYKRNYMRDYMRDYRKRNPLTPEQREQRREYMRKYMRDYMRKRRAAERQTSQEAGTSQG